MPSPTARIATTITAVTVYRSGARVQRAGELTPSADGGFPDVITIGDLPLCLDDSTLRLRVESDNGAAAPVAADLRVAVELPEVDTGLRTVDDEALEAARREEHAAGVVLRRLESELSLLRDVEIEPRPEGAEGEPPRSSPIETRKGFADFRAEREVALRKRLADAKLTHWEAVERRRREQDRYERESTQRQRQSDELRKAAVVSLSTAADGETAATGARVVVEYLVRGACWAPAYSLRLGADYGAKDGVAQLGLRALVAQHTGEDWHGVDLTLSTAAPHYYVEPPELASQRIGRRQPPPPKAGWREPPIGTDALFEDWDRAFADLALAPERTFGRALATEAAERERDEPARRPEPVPSAMPAGGEAVTGAAFDEGRATYTTSGAHTPQAPPQQAMSMGAAPAPELQQPKRRSRKRSSPVGTAAAALVAGPAALAAKGVDAFLNLSGGSAAPPPSAAPGRGGQPLAEPRPEPGDLLRYGDLRMPAATSPRRGRLALTSRHELYLELFIAQKVTVEVDVGGALAEKLAQARRVGAALPKGHELARSEHYDYAYTADAAVDIASNGDFHGIPLTSVGADAKLRYVVVPRESTDVFRLVEVDNPLDAPLLPGPVDVYVGGRFLLTAGLDFTSPKGRFDLGLGVEQGIKVARNTRFREESGGFVSKRLELHHSIEIELRNSLNSGPDSGPDVAGGDARIEVRERIPVTRKGEDEIEVELGEVNPAWDQWEPDPERASDTPLRGGYRWRVRLPAGERKELKARYVVTLPSKHELVGGNRREA